MSTCKWSEMCMKWRWGGVGWKILTIKGTKKGTCTKMSHERDLTANMNQQVKRSNQLQMRSPLHRGVLTHLWLLQRTNKYVLTEKIAFDKWFSPTCFLPEFWEVFFWAWLAPQPAVSYKPRFSCRVVFKRRLASNPGADYEKTHWG